MTAAPASPTVRPAPFRPLPPTRSAGNGPSATSWEASSAPSVVEYTLGVTLPVAEQAVDEPVPRRPDPVVEFVRFLLTQWVAAFVTYEVLAATANRKGRSLPTLGL